jgi:hypothetical protein
MIERKKGGKRARIEEQPGKKATRLHAEKLACPRRGNHQLSNRV